MVYLAHATTRDVEDYLQIKKTIIIPIGSTEQHGSHGLLSTDTICALEIAKEIGERSNIAVGPAIPIGMAQHHLSFAGTISVRPSTIIAFCSDLINSLVCTGFNRIIFLNGHGGNIHSYKAAIDEYYFSVSTSPNSAEDNVSVTLHNWWDPSEVSEYCIKNFGVLDGDHVTASEISIVHHLHKEQRPFPKSETTRTSSFTNSRDFIIKFPDGRVGSYPHLASAEHGASLIDLSCIGLIRELEL